MLPDMFSRWSIFFLITAGGLANTFHIRHYPVRVSRRVDSAYNYGVAERGQHRHTVREDQTQQKRWIRDDENQVVYLDDYLETEEQNDLDDYGDYGYADYIYVPPSPFVAFGPVAKNFNVQGLFNRNAASGIEEMTADGLPCSPVWKYKKKIFFGCTTSRAGPLWCSTKVDGEHNHILGHWGWCAPDKVKPKPNLMPGSSCSAGFGVCRLNCQPDEIVAVDLTKEKGCSPTGVPLCCINANGEDPFVDNESSDTSGGTTNGLDDTNTDVSVTTSAPDTRSTNLMDAMEDPGVNTNNHDAISDSPGTTTGATTINPDTDSAVPGTSITNPDTNGTEPGTIATDSNATTPDSNGVTSVSNDTIFAVLHVSTFSPEAYSGTAGDSNGTNVTKQVIVVHNVTTSILNDLSFKPVTSSPNPESTRATSGTSTNNPGTTVPGTNAPDADVAESGSSASDINTAVTIPGTDDANNEAVSDVPDPQVSNSTSPSTTIAGAIANSPDASSDNSATTAPNPDTTSITIGGDASNPGDNAANLVGATSQLSLLENPINAAENGGFESETMELSADGSEFHADVDALAASNTRISVLETVLNEYMAMDHRVLAMDTNQAASNNKLVETKALDSNNQVAVSQTDSILQHNKREVQGAVTSSKGSILQALLSKVEDTTPEYEDEAVASSYEDSLDESSVAEYEAIHDENISSIYVDDIVRSDEEVIANDSSQSAASGDIEPALP